MESWSFHFVFFLDYTAGIDATSNGDSAPSIDPSKTIVSENGIPVLKYGDMRIDANGLPIISSSVPQIRTSVSASQLKTEAMDSTQKATTFEAQIRRRLQTVSDLVATYSDSISEHSAESGKPTKERKKGGEKAIGTVEKEAAVVLAGNGNGDGDAKKDSMAVDDGELM